MTRPASLLIDEPPLQVLPTLAERIGLNEAIVLQQVHYWLRNSKNVVDGQKWTFDTYEDWQQKNFKFWSVKTVQRAFLSLEEQGLLISMQPDKRDRRKWYTIDYDLLEEFSSDTHTPSDGSASDSPPSGQNDLLQEDNLALSDGTTCPLASGQFDLLEEHNLSSPTGQHVPLYKDPETSSETPGELTHTPPTPSPPTNGKGNGKACVCKLKHNSEFCDDVRLAYARGKPSIKDAGSYAQSKEVRAGRDDLLIREWQQQVEQPWKVSTARDTSQCPDCHGRGMWEPGGPGKGAARCRHPQLPEAAEVR